MIEEQLRAFADDLDGRQSPITVDEIMSRSATRTAREVAGPRRLTLVAAAVVVVVGIIGVASVAVDRSEPARSNDEVIPIVSPVSPATVPVPTTAPSLATSAPASTAPGPVGFPATPTTNPPTSGARVDVSWWVPTALPDDLSFRYALDWTGHHREVLFGSGDCSPVCDRSVLVTTEDFMGESTGEAGLGGRVWNTTRDPGSMFLRSDDQFVMLRSENLTSEELAEIAAGLRLLPETELPRLPLVCCPYTLPDGVDPGPVVAHIQLETPTGVKRWDLHAYTDGAQFALSGYNRSDETPGPFYLASPERPIILGARPGYYTTPRLPEGTGLIYGVAHPDVATVDVALRDGQTITYQPQDESELFHENFVFLTIPLANDGEGADVFSQIVEIVARDSNHNELFRCGSASSCLGL